MSNKATGLKTIAYELGLSINTVSRALRDCDDIAESTKETVRKKAYELGYQTNSLSQFLKRDDRPLIAVIVNGLDNYFFVVVAQKLIRLIQKDNCDFAIIVGGADIGDEDLIKQCISQRADGIISLIDLDKKAYESAQFAHISVVSYGESEECFFVDQVVTDNKIGCSLAAKYLINFHKLTRLGYLTDRNINRSKTREAFFREAALRVNPNVKVETIYLDEVQEKLPEDMESGLLGFFAFNDSAAYKTLDYLNSIIPNVRRIYHNFHLIGYDAVSLRMSGLIDITSIDYDYDLMCEKTLGLLKERIASPNKKQSIITIPVSLHVRKIV